MLRSIFRSDFASYLTQKRNVSEIQKTTHIKKISQYYLLTKLGSGSSGKVYLSQVDPNFNHDNEPNQIHSLNSPPKNSTDSGTTNSGQDIKIDDYQIEETKKGKNFAIKAIKLQTKHCHHATSACDLEREIRIMKILHHQNIVQLHDAFYSPQKNTAYLVIDWAQYGSLQKAIMNNIRFDEKSLAAIFIQVINGLSYLHSQGIVHHDIKPLNILLFQDGHVKLSDFGIGHSFGSAFAVMGTPAYQAPELLIDEDYVLCVSQVAYTTPQPMPIDITPSSDSEQDSNANSLSSSDIFYDYDPVEGDIWSLGVTIYETAFGMLPYMGENYYEIVNAINQTPLKIPSNFEHSGYFINLLKEMLQSDPSKRITMRGIKEHPFFTRNFENLSSDDCAAYLKTKMESLNMLPSNQLTVMQPSTNVIDIPVERYKDGFSFSTYMQPPSVYQYLNANAPPKFEAKKEIII